MKKILNSTAHYSLMSPLLLFRQNKLINNNGSAFFSTKEKNLPHRFADPKYDHTFKKLFGSETNKDILIATLNSFLTLKNDIVDVSLNDTALERRDILSSTPSISGAVDILCTTTTGQRIAVEMQSNKTSYFLTREQEYMAKLISGQVTSGSGAYYHKEVLDTYIIVIAKNNIFTGNTALKDQSIYEIDVLPTVQQTQEIYPGNKMSWKFFELSKFIKHEDSKCITKESPLKLQWLDFLINSPSYSDIPLDTSNIIKKAYHVMDTLNWSTDEQTMHWKNAVTEEDQEALRIEEITLGKAEGKAEGIAEGEAKAIKKALKHNETDEEILEDISLLTPEKLSSIKKLPQPPNTDIITKILLSDIANDIDYLRSVEISGNIDEGDSKY